MITIQIIKERQRVTITEYYHEFTDKYGSGYSFPCDEHGNRLNGNEYSDANQNYSDCLNGKHPNLIDRGIQGRERSYVEPAEAVCICGEQIQLIPDVYASCGCEHCGRLYSLNGQLYLPREMWDERLDDDY